MNIFRAAPGSVCDSGQPGASTRLAAWIVDVEPAHFENARCLLGVRRQSGAATPLWIRLRGCLESSFTNVHTQCSTDKSKTPSPLRSAGALQIIHHHTIDNRCPAPIECKCSSYPPATVVTARSYYLPFVDSETCPRPTARPEFHYG